MKLLAKIEQPQFVKTAARFTLSDNPQTYPSELTAHLYKQHPYLGKYDVNLNIQGQDDSMGYLYGTFLISPSGQAPQSASKKRMGMVETEAGPEPNPEETIRIPIIVAEKKVHPFDVFITPSGQFLPLSEQRLASELFSSSPYMIAPKSALTQAQLSSAAKGFSPDMPVSASGYGTGFGPPNAAIQKTGSVLSKVANLVSKEQSDEFIYKVASDKWLKHLSDTDEEFNKSVRTILTFDKKAAAATHEFDVAVLSKAPGGYSLITTQLHPYKTKTAFISNYDAESLDLSVRQKIATEGSCLLSDNDTELCREDHIPNLEKVASTGVYAVMSSDGVSQRAAVIKDIVRFDGSKTKLAYIIGESGASLQEDASGIRCGDLDLEAIRGTNPRGEGTFIFNKTASTPVTVKQSVTNQDGETYYVAEDAHGYEINIKTAAVRMPVQVSRGVYMIPQESRFVPLQFGASYRSDEISMTKAASFDDNMNKVYLVSDGSQFSLSGRPVEQVGSDHLDGRSTLLMLGALGDTQEGALDKMAEAKSGEKVAFVANRVLTSKNLIQKDMSDLIETAAAISIDLTKEASVLAGSDTVDSVLSLNFITPENIQGYIGALPEYEQSVSKLAELVVGIRLGLSDIPEAAVGSAMRGLEKAILGLKKLQLRMDFAT